MLTCDHCLLTFPEREAVFDEFKGEKKTFCCQGCRGVYHLIYDEGLDSFYWKRTWHETGIEKAVFEKTLDITSFLEAVRDAEGGKEIDLVIEGIRCASCVWLNERILARTPGVLSARVNYSTHRARIRWNPGAIGLEKILGRIRAIGYMPKPFSESEQILRRRSESRDLLIRFGTAGFLSSQLMIYSIALYAGYFEGIDPGTKRILQVIALVLTIPVLFYAGMPFFRNTVTGLRHFRFTMDSLIAMGAGSAFLYSIYGMATGGEVYFDTSVMIITLILLGRYIESLARGRASETIEKLLELTSKEATRLSREGTGSERIPVSALMRGDLVEVKPGEKFPLDGIVRKGQSEADESLLTGESKPVFKTAGAGVIGGSQNLFGSVVFEVTRTGKETMLAGIIRAVEDAQSSKPRIQTVADRVVGFFVPGIILAGLLTVLFHSMRGTAIQESIMNGISVLVISCPCSLGLATPLAVLVFTSILSSKGILLRRGDVIESAGRISHVVFDKTGTVTVGRPSVKELIVFDPNSTGEGILSIAASVERLSEHSIGNAIVRFAKDQGISAGYEITGFRSMPGRGIEGVVDGKNIVIGNREFLHERSVSILNHTAEGKRPGELASGFEQEGCTVVYVAWDGALRALIALADIVREEAPPAVADLKKICLSLSLVSGDNAATTSAVASAVGIDQAVSGVSPVQKREIIRRFQSEGQNVLMVGDGINDAPALIEASVGVAMGRGTDIAMESADAVLVRNDLRLIPAFIKLSRRSFSIIKQNIFWAFFYNVVAIPLAVAGVLHPIIAAGAMAASSLFVVGNSLRIRSVSD